MRETNWFEKSEQLIDTLTSSKDCALIWRPHPLMESTIQSMKPTSWGSYKKLKEKVLSKDNAVLDTRSDVYLSMTVSDALISDRSSILRQYTITKKPILCLNGSSSQKESICLFDYSKDYFLNDGMTIEAFRDMVLKGEDPKQQERLLAMKKSVVNTNGKCGEYIHRVIKGEVMPSAM
ncbi:MAG: hypothetical protein ACFWUC_13255 [Oscillospiraceae bacterium]